MVKSESGLRFFAVRLKGSRKLLPGASLRVIYVGRPASQPFCRAVYVVRGSLLAAQGAKAKEMPAANS